MKKVGVGIAGLGSISERHVSAIEKSDGLELVAICHHRKEHLEKRASEWGIKSAYVEYSDMLEDEKVDAVIIATPNNLHASMTIEAIEANKHVLCEKPPALNRNEMDQVLKKSKKSDRVVMYGLMFRFSEKHNIVLELRKENTFGEIYYSKAGIIRRAGNPGGWFANKEISGGGPITDLGSHVVDLAISLMGDYEPCSVFARTFNKAENLENIKATGGYKALTSDLGINDVEQGGALIINFTNGACLVVEASYTSHIKEDKLYLELQGTKGGVKVDPEFEIYTTKEDYLVDIKPKVNCKDFDHQGSIDAEVQHFSDCISKGEKCITSVEVGAKVMRIISAAYESAESQELIKL